eukprot:11752-Heterococcus_DN1.PRE.2
MAKVLVSITAVVAACVLAVNSILNQTTRLVAQTFYAARCYIGLQSAQHCMYAQPLCHTYTATAATSTWLHIHTLQTAHNGHQIRRITKLLKAPMAEGRTSAVAHSALLRSGCCVVECQQQYLSVHTVSSGSSVTEANSVAHCHLANGVPVQAL